MIAAIWAQDQNGLIGKEDKLPWHLPADLKFFKRMTEQNTIVMGRPTFEGMGSRLLPNRQTIILSSDQTYTVPNALVMHSIQEVLDYAKEYEGIVYVSGGAKIYAAFMPYLDVLYRTLIKGTFAGDTHFPPVNWAEWTLTSESSGAKDEVNPYDYVYETYHRKNQ